MAERLVLRPRSLFTMFFGYLALALIGGLAAFCTLVTVMALVGAPPLALFFGGLAVLFGWCALHVYHHMLAYRRTCIVFDDRLVTTIRIAACGGQLPTYVTEVVDLGAIVRLGYGERLEQAKAGYLSRACVWVEDVAGKRTVLAGGPDPYADLAKSVAAEVTRRTGLVACEERGFRSVGMFGGIEPGASTTASGPVVVPGQAARGSVA